MHIPKYPSNGAIHPTAINFAISSIMLAESGTIFLPTPCKLLLRISSTLSTKKKGMLIDIYLIAVSITTESVLPDKSLTAVSPNENTAAQANALHTNAIIMDVVMPFFTLGICPAP